MFTLAKVASATNIPLENLCEDPSLDPAQTQEIIINENNEYLLTNYQNPFQRLQEKHTYQHQQLFQLQNTHVWFHHKVICQF